MVIWRERGLQLPMSNFIISKIRKATDSILTHPWLHGFAAIAAILALLISFIPETKDKPGVDGNQKQYTIWFDGYYHLVTRNKVLGDWPITKENMVYWKLEANGREYTDLPANGATSILLNTIDIPDFVRDADTIKISIISKNGGVHKQLSNSLEYSSANNPEKYNDEDYSFLEPFVADAIFKEGITAKKNGVLRSENPYFRSFLTSQIWLLGWYEEETTDIFARLVSNDDSVNPYGQPKTYEVWDNYYSYLTYRYNRWGVQNSYDDAIQRLFIDKRYKLINGGSFSDDTRILNDDGIAVEVLENGTCVAASESLMIDEEEIESTKEGGLEEIVVTVGQTESRVLSCPAKVRHFNSLVAKYRSLNSSSLAGVVNSNKFGHIEEPKPNHKDCPTTNQDLAVLDQNEYDSYEKYTTYNELTSNEADIAFLASLGIDRDPSYYKVVFFDSESNIDIRTKVILTAHALILKNASSDVTVIGHSEKCGTLRQQRELALLRAKKIQEVFISLGLKPDKIRIESRGNSFPLRQGNDANANQINRRVEIRY